MKIENQYYSIVLDDINGSVSSYTGNSAEYAAEKKFPLIEISLMDVKGARRRLSSLSAAPCEKVVSESKITLTFRSFCGEDIDISAEISFDDTPFVKWRLNYINRTSFDVEWINFPGLLFSDKMNEKEGYKVFLPIFEGVEISDFALRDKFFPYAETDYPSKGWEGVYPGPVSMQFTAYYNGKNGVYVAAHDKELNTKTVDAHASEEGIIFDTKLFPGSEQKEYRYGFDYVTGIYEGGWYEAAEIYRRFIEDERFIKQPKLYENPKVSKWLKESPLITIYPVRGEKDTGDMSPNEYYPYTNALKYLKTLAENTDSKILAMLCHWEGSAPWCPPYVWPPYGDIENFKLFEQKLHENGMLFGLYCSGIAWTQKSIFTDYNKEKEFKDENLAEAMCLAPDGSLPYCAICNDYIRWGYDMCPGSERTVKLIRAEVSKIVHGTKVDYLQLFDQNLGGNASICYSPSHNHARTPGVRETAAMRRLIKKAQDAADEASENHVMLGCEAAASEGFTDLLLMNDGRNYQGFMIGCPVPAYEFLYHEYVATFMGNQNTTFLYLDAAENRDNIFYRTAKFFAQGELLTVVLKDHGKINWDWGTPWNTVDPDQERYLRFVKKLNNFRKGEFSKFFYCGRLAKPYRVECDNYELKFKNGMKNKFPAVITTALEWDNRKIQLLVNPFERELRYVFSTDKKNISFRYICNDIRVDFHSKSLLEGVIPPDDVIILEFLEES